MGYMLAFYLGYRMLRAINKDEDSDKKK